MWGTTGFGYDSTKVDPPDSWSVFFEPDPNSDIYGRVTMLDDPRESFAAALAYLGYDINTTDEAQLNEAKDALIRAKAQLAGYDSDTYEDLVASGENLLAHGWNGDFLLAMEDNENIAYVTPKEGGVVFVDNLCIPASATPEQKLAGEMLINFLLEPEIAARNSQFIYYASPNKAAEAFLPADFLNDTSIYPPAEVLDKLQYLEPVGEVRVRLPASLGRGEVGAIRSRLQVAGCRLQVTGSCSGRSPGRLWFRSRPLATARHSRVGGIHNTDDEITGIPMPEMFINGRWTAGQSTERIAVINPATEEVLADVPRGTAADADAAVQPPPTRSTTGGARRPTNARRCCTRSPASSTATSTSWPAC